MSPGLLLSQSFISITGLDRGVLITPFGMSIGASLGVPSPLATIFTDDFETGALTDPNRYQDIISNGGSPAFTIVNVATAGIPALNGSRVLQVGPPGGALTHFVSTAATSPYEKLHLTYYLYRTTAYQQANNAMRVIGLRGSTTQFGSFGVGYNTPGSCPDDPNNAHQQEFMFSYLEGDFDTFAVRLYTEWLNQTKLQLSPPQCGGNYAVSGSPVATYTNLAAAMPINTWNKIELEVQLNTVGQANGYSRIWMDGVLLVDHSNVVYRTNSNMKLWGMTVDSGNLAGGPAAAYYIDSIEVRG